MEDNYKLLNRLAEAERYFTQEKYIDIVKRAKELFECGKHATCEKELDTLPTDGELLETLVKKLRGKSVAKTLKQIQEGKIGNDVLTAKGLSSLLTHILIEIEQGSNEYKVLIPNVVEKLNEIIYSALQ